MKKLSSQNRQNEQLIITPPEANTDSTKDTIGVKMPVDEWYFEQVSPLLMYEYVEKIDQEEGEDADQDEDDGS